MKSKTPIYISLIILISCLFLILRGSPILNIPLIKEGTFPIGTLISWIGLISFNIAIYLIFNVIHKSNRSIDMIFRFAFRSIIILASLWGFIGFLLANNWAFTFENHVEFRGGIGASQYFWIYTASLVLFPVLLILIYWFILLSKKLLKDHNR